MRENPDSSSERTNTLPEWRNRILSAILGIAVTVCGALIIGKFQARDPHLTFTSTESVPFSGPNGEVSIYQVTLSNDGKKEVYDVGCAIRVAAAKIDQYKVTADPLLNVTGLVASDTLNIQVPNLNPSESIQISILASGSQTMPAHTEVTARGKGVVASERKESAGKSPFGTLPLISLGAASLALLVSSIARSSLLKSQSTGTGDDQRQILAFLCRSHGLEDLAEMYSSQQHETTYWGEADRLGQRAIDAGGDRMARIERTLLALLEYKRMVKASRAIVYYNLALISRTKKDVPGSKKYLQDAKNTSKDSVERRLKIDPRFSDS